MTWGDFRRWATESLDYQIAVPSENSGERHEGYTHTQLETPEQHKSEARIYYPLSSAWIWNSMGCSRLFGVGRGQGRSDPALPLFAGWAPGITVSIPSMGPAEANPFPVT